MGTDLAATSGPTQLKFRNQSLLNKENLIKSTSFRMATGFYLDGTDQGGVTQKRARESNTPYHFLFTLICCRDLPNWLLDGFK